MLVRFKTLQIHVHDTMESLYKAVGMAVLPDEYLPDDYTGPSAGPIQQIIGKYSHCNNMILICCSC